MNERDSLVLLLKDLDRQAAPTREFTEELWAQLLAELAEQDGAGARQRVPRPRFTPPRYRRPLLAGGVVLALVVAAIAAVLLSRPSRASALEVIQQARRQFIQLPAFRATIVVKNPDGMRIVYQRFYRDPDAWRSEVASAVDPNHAAHAGDYEVWNGRLLGVYRVDDPHHFYVTPANEARAANQDRAATEDLDPHFYSWPGPRPNTRLPADQFFKRNCEVLPNELVAGREARHLACHYGGARIGIWLDARFGFILRLIGPGGGLFEVRRIAINPSFPTGVFDVAPPPGSKETWAGNGPIPPELRQKPSGRVSATIPVGSNPAEFAVGAGSVWVANPGDGSVTRIDPTSNLVIATIAGLQAYGLTFADGAPWVATNSGLLERIDPATNRLAGPPVAVGGGSTPYRDVGYGDGTLWMVGGKRRTVRLPGGTIDPNYASLLRVDPANGRVVADIRIPADLAGSAGIAVGEGAAWVVSPRESLLLFRIDPKRNRVVDTLDLGRYGAGKIVTALGSVWLTVSDDTSGYLLRIDPRSDRVVARIRVGQEPNGFAIGAGSIWVANIEGGTLSQVDPSTNRVVGAPLPIGDVPTGATYGFDALWVAVNRDNAVVRVNQADLP